MCLNRPKVASALGRIDLNEMMSLAINCQVRALSSAGTSPQVLSDDVWHLIIDNVCLNSGLYAGKAVRRLACISRVFAMRAATHPDNMLPLQRE